MKKFPTPYRWKPTNPEKYIGDANNIIVRSSWEKKAFLLLDKTPAILKWNSEENIIPYVSPIDNKTHRYFVDLTIMYRTKTGTIKKAIVEIKPKAQTRPPEMKSRKSKRYITESVTYLVNEAKWNAARAWAATHDFDFLIWTETELGIK